jgi:hypothetical protein
LKLTKVFILIFYTSATDVAFAYSYDITCFGNLETFDKHIIKADVSYKLSYSISNSTANIRFAGREFDASVETGNSWKGNWLRKDDEEIYFSFLPSDGGTIKFQFEPNLWYSGNC